MIINPMPHSVKNFFKKQKWKYPQHLIDYKGCPTKKAYIGVAKKPLMPSPSGIGFMGVLLQDENRQKVQCSGCGVWRKKINAAHTKKCCGLNLVQYKKRFGLMASRGLVSDETSLAYTKNALKAKENIERFVRERHSGKFDTIGNRGKSRKSTIEERNRYGTCPLQLKERLYAFIRENRELPSQSNRGKGLNQILRRRYQSWGHALKDHGLPMLCRSGTNMKYTFSDGTVYEYNINQFPDREKLFQMLMKKCPVLTQE